MTKNKLIYTSYSPNTRFKDLRENITLLLIPLIRWIDGNSIGQVKKYFKRYYPEHEVYLYNFARSALFEFFSSIKHKDDDEIIFQGFTCAAASLPAIWAGYKPVYVDIEKDSLITNTKLIEKSITERTKIVVIQYTLGQVPNVEEITELCASKGILLLEDCTHYLPSSSDILLGINGDAAVFSFGRDKVVSGVDGGILIIKNSDIDEVVSTRYASLTPPKMIWIIERLHFALVWWFIKALWIVGLGKPIHLVATKAGLLSKATTKEEKSGKLPDSIPALLPNAMASLAYTQLEDIEELQKHRRDISKIYRKELKNVEGITLLSDYDITPLRFPILIDADIRDDVVTLLYKSNIVLGDWYNVPVAPSDIPFTVSRYSVGHSLNSEEVCSRIVNLPTHINISFQDAKYVCSELRATVSHLRGMNL